jgi:hypothetical protein
MISHRLHQLIGIHHRGGAVDGAGSLTAIHGPQRGQDRRLERTGPRFLADGRRGKEGTLASHQRPLACDGFGPASSSSTC